MIKSNGGWRSVQRRSVKFNPSWVINGSTSSTSQELSDQKLGKHAIPETNTASFREKTKQQLKIHETSNGEMTPTDSRLEVLRDDGHGVNHVGHN